MGLPIGEVGQMKHVIAVLLVSQVALSQLPPPLTGNLRLDLALAADSSVGGRGAEQPREKSVMRAALYSAIIPGAGEFYAEAYWRAAVFFGAEVILWIVHTSYDGKGDRQTEEFQRYADAYWSVVRYAEWMETHGPSLNPNPPPGGIVVNSDPNVPPWDRVDWEKLNAWEQHIGGVPSTGFSHRLPRRPDQQYYELIGKYLQYNMGWEDWDPSRTDYLAVMSARFQAYRDMRGRANDFYTVARTAAAMIVANHLLSMVDAALGARAFNEAVRLETRLVPTARSLGFVEFVPTASLSVSF